MRRCVPFYDCAPRVLSIPRARALSNLTRPDSAGMKYVSYEGRYREPRRYRPRLREGVGGRAREDSSRIAIFDPLSVNSLRGRRLRRSCGEFLAKRPAGNPPSPYIGRCVPKAAIYMSCGKVSTAWRALRSPKRILRASHRERGWTLLLLGCAPTGHVGISMFR